MMARQAVGAFPGRRLLLAVVVALVVLGLVGAGWWVYWDMVSYKLTTVTEGQVFRSAAMPPETLVKIVQQHRIRSVVDLRAEHEVPAELAGAEARALARLGIDYLSLPSAQVPDAATVQRFLDHVEKPESRPLLIHCRDGEGRSVLFAALYRIEVEGWSNDRARRSCRLFPGLSSFAADRPKGRFLEEYRARNNDAN